LFKATREAECTAASGGSMTLDAAFVEVCNLCRSAHDIGGKAIFIGNGGSMGIATHMAVDFSKTGGMRAMSLGDGAVLTAWETTSVTKLFLHARSNGMGVPETC
jgi:D-sedoheptulose 7-phosphate isomerase